MKEERFWKNYFFHCQSVRAEHLELRAAKIHASQSKAPGVIEASASNAREKMKLGVGDDESLVPASEVDDDSSYVLPSAPTTGNTQTTTRSVDDLVVVNTHGILAATGEGDLV